MSTDFTEYSQNRLQRKNGAANARQKNQDIRLTFYKHKDPPRTGKFSEGLCAIALTGNACQGRPSIGRDLQIKDESLSKRPVRA